MPGTRIIPMDEVKQHDSGESLWMVIHSGVYDVTKFLSEHPGGEDALLDYAGEEASQAFDDVGHSTAAKKLLNDFKIGVIQEEKKCNLCGHFKKYAPYGAAVLAVGTILAFIVLRSR